LYLVDGLEGGMDATTLARREENEVASLTRREKGRGTLLSLTIKRGNQEWSVVAANDHIDTEKLIDKEEDRRRACLIPTTEQRGEEEFLAIEKEIGERINLWELRSCYRARRGKKKTGQGPSSPTKKK